MCFPVPSKPTPPSCLSGLFCLFGIIGTVISGLAIEFRAYKHGLADHMAKEFIPFFIGGVIASVAFGFLAKYFYHNGA